MAVSTVANVSENSISSHSSMAEKASEVILEYIETRILKPGQVLDFAALSKELKISRTPIRESVRKLHLDGLLEGVPGGQFRVALLTPDKIVDYYAVRSELEVAVTTIATHQIANEELDMLAYNMKLFSLHIDEPKVLTKLDKQFHEIIYDASHNRYLRRRLTSLRIIMGLLPVNTYQDEARISAILKEHTAIYHALRQRDENAAADAIKLHLENSQRT